MDRGGAEMRTIDLMRQDALRSFEFHFATLGVGAGSLDETIRELNGHVHSCPLTGTFPRRFRRLLRDHDYDVVHSHVHYFSGYTLRLAAKEGVSTRIAHFRSTGDGQSSTWRRRIQRFVMTRWIDRYATNIVAVSTGVMDSAWHSNWRDDPRCRVVYSGLDLNPFTVPVDRAAVRREFNVPRDAILIIHVGSLSTWKNQQRLLHIFARLHQTVPESRLLLVGRDGDGSRRRIEETISALKLQHAVTVAGERQDIVRLLKAADLMIFPSLREGLPGAIVEACAAGTPVVAAEIPGAREIASAFPTVLCVPLEADDSEWIATARRLLEAPPARNDLAGGQFDATTAAYRFKELYELQPA